MSAKPRQVLRATAAVALGGFVLTQAPVAEASAVSTTPILVVHGFDFGRVTGVSDGINCKDSVMLAWVQGLKSRGFTTVKTVGWYKNDVNCDLYVPGRGDNTVNTSLDQVAREFTNLVSDKYPTTAVAISAHSMGGLMVRRALDGVQNRHADFSANIRVSDVVTSGTPHAGTGWANGCGFTQCVQARPSSPFINALAHNPQTTGGTDWTLIGSGCDLVVSAASATSMNQVTTSRPTVFRFIFAAPNPVCFGGVSHNELVTKSGPLNVINTGLRTSN